MKVLFLIDSLQGGGAERSLAEMLPGLAARGVDPIVVCLDRRADNVEDLILGRFDLRYIEARRAPGRVRAVRRMIREERPDLVHTTLLRSDLIGRFAAAGTGVPVLTSLVNLSYDPIRFSDPRIRPWVFRRVQAFDGWTARRFNEHFHAITGAVKDHNVAALGIEPDRVTVVLRGRDGSRLGSPSPDRRNEARRRLGLSDDDDVLVNVGRQEFQKGQRYLLEAIERLTAAGRRPVALILGRRGVASAELDELAKRPGLEGRVRFLGHVDDVADVLAAADVFVFPSLFEGLGGSLIEAMALGLPIVASDLPAVREVLEDGANAALVPPADAGALAGAIAGLLGDRARAARFGRRSRELFEERYTLEASTEQMASLYHRIVGSAVETPAVLEPAHPTMEGIEGS